MSVSKRELLATLARSELLDIGRCSELDVTGKMTKEEELLDHKSIRMRQTDGEIRVVAELLEVLT